MKEETRFLGIYNVPFTTRTTEGNKIRKNKTSIIGAVTRGGDSLEGVMSTEITIDGSDSTDQIIKMINESRYKSQIQGIFLNGISIGGLNLINIQKVFRETGIPTIIIMRKPTSGKLTETLTKLNLTDKIPILESAGGIFHFRHTFYQVAGILPHKVEEMLNLTRTNSMTMPEPLRLAKIISSGINH